MNTQATSAEASARHAVLPLAARPASRTMAFLLLVALAETLLAAAALRGLLSPAAFLVSHLVVIVFAERWIAVDGRRYLPAADFSPLYVWLMATFVAGPLGAGGGIALLLAQRRLPSRSHLLDAWYHRLADSVETDRENRLYQDIVNNRARGTVEVRIERFGQVMETGSLAEKQALLGIIALNYRPDYRAFLFAALRDEEPSVRAQAAATYVKLQEDAKTRLRKLLAADPMPSTAVAANEASSPHSREGIIAGLEDVAGSGLLERADIARAARAAQRLAAADEASAEAELNPTKRLNSLLQRGDYPQLQQGLFDERQRTRAVIAARLEAAGGGQTGSRA